MFTYRWCVCYCWWCVWCYYWSNTNSASSGWSSNSSNEVKERQNELTLLCSLFRLKGSVTVTTKSSGWVITLVWSCYMLSIDLMKILQCKSVNHMVFISLIHQEEFMMSVNQLLSMNISTKLNMHTSLLTQHSLKLSVSN